MKETVLKRSMFSDKIPKSVRNSGIMAGFEDDDMLQAPEEQDSMPSMARTPQNPEILMNTLRGDMRSVDARYQELAQMVGDEAAQETPPEVLAMLQMQLGQQQGGIGGLPQGAGMMPPPMDGGAPMGGPGGAPAMPSPQGGMPPQGAMPPGMESAPPLPQGGAEQAPQGYALGGSVTGSGNIDLHIPIDIGGGGGGLGVGLGGGGGLGMGLGGGGQTALQEGFGGGMLSNLLPSIHSMLRDQQNNLASPAAGMGSPFPQQLLGGEYPSPSAGQQFPVSTFAHGGSVYPATPDGMPPMHAATGAIVNAGTRAAQFLADKAATYGPRVNQYLGNLMMSPQPTIQRLTGGEPAMNLTRQAGESLVRNPVTGEIVQAAGTRLAPYTTMGPFSSPTLTQGISQGVERLAAEYPRAASMLAPAGAAFTAVAGPLMDQMSPSTPMSAEDQARYDATMAQIDAVNARPQAGAGRGLVNPPSVDPRAAAPTNTVYMPRPEGPTAQQIEAFVKKDEEPAEDKSTEEFINQALAKPQFKELSRIERIKQARDEYTPLYKELIGDSNEDAKTNALLLLADAGFKLASTYKPTFAMAVAESAKDLPRGFANIIAQAKDRDIKLKTAALTQAISDVQEQDKYAQALKMQILKGDYDLLKTQAKEGAVVMEDAGLGGRLSKTKSGSFVGFHLDPKDPAVDSALRSRYTLRDTDNPFVMNRGEAPTTVETNKDERIKLGNALRNIDNNLSTIDSMKSTVERAYSPGTWFADKVNNVFVPISFGVIKPNFDTAGAVTQLKNDFSKVTKNSAAAAESGRISNQQQEWERENAGMLANPAGFFEDPELAAKNLTSLEATNRNMRQQILTQLGYEKNDYVMTAPNTGTKNDPYVISSDPREQKIMFNFLGSTFGRVQDPKAVVYLKLPNGKVDAFNPSQLRAQTGR